MKDDLKIIKKKYGEEMMHLCRRLFNTILDESPGTLSTILLETFIPNHDLYQDIIINNLEIRFKNYIYNIYEQLKKNKKVEKRFVEDPVTLMKKAGYILFECETEEEIQAFRRFYAKGEELCTFTCGNRLDSCYVYFAIREDVKEFTREDFPNPEREDRYGTSVISIQFTRDDSHTLSIKNRYNHTVKNPDATFSNNLDNIIPGLTQSFEDYYGMEQSYAGYGDFDIYEYIRANDGKFYKYNYEIDNVYYCPNNIVIDNFQVKKYSFEKYLVMDYFILDLVNKKFINNVEDSFPETIGNIKSINIKNIDSQKIVTITSETREDFIIVLDKYNQIVELINHNIKEIGDNFLHFNDTLKVIDIKNTTKIGNNFMAFNNKIKSISLPNVEVIGDDFIIFSRITDINIPNVKKIGNNFMLGNFGLRRIDIPEVTDIGDGFLNSNEMMSLISLPKVIRVGDDFCKHNISATQINFSNLEIIGSDFFKENRTLNNVCIPNVKKIGDNFMVYNQGVKIVNFPNILEIGTNFMRLNRLVREIYMPNIKTLGQGALEFSNNIEKFYAPNLEKKLIKIRKK